MILQAKDGISRCEIYTHHPWHHGIQDAVMDAPQQLEVKPWGFPFESSKLVTPFCGYFTWIGGSNIFQEKTVDGSEMRR